LIRSSLARSLLRSLPVVALLAIGLVLAVAPSAAPPAGASPPRAPHGQPFSFSTGNPDGKIGTASRPGSAGTPVVKEIESADDFVLTEETSLTSATFTGLLVGLVPTSTVQTVVVEIYRVFPKDSDVFRTSGPPTFSTAEVPTRVNSPSDVALASREGTNPISVTDTLSFTTSVVAPTFHILNSVQPGGIHPKPGQTTGGNGPLDGQEVLFSVNFTVPIDLPADHYFFIPQVKLSTGEFYWLSAPRPIVAPGTPFPAGATDLQSWTRDADLDPDWLRIGTDIVGGSPAPTFNAAFSLTGDTIATPTPTATSTSTATSTPSTTATATATATATPQGFAGNLRLITPVRVVDTRATDTAASIFTIGFNPDGTPITPGRLTANATRRFLINGKTFNIGPPGSPTYTFPSDVKGVQINVTIVQDIGTGGFVTVFPGDVPDADRPNASTVNPITPIAFNSTTVGVPTAGANAGTIAVFSTNALDLIIDVSGIYE